MKTQFGSFSAFSLFKSKSRAFLAEDTVARWEFTRKTHLDLASRHAAFGQNTFSFGSAAWAQCTGTDVLVAGPAGE